MDVTGPVEIVIFNVRGQRVATLVSDTKAPGTHEVSWNGTTDRGETIASGIYFLRVRLGSERFVKKVAVIK